MVPDLGEVEPKDGAGETLRPHSLPLLLPRVLIDNVDVQECSFSRAHADVLRKWLTSRCAAPLRILVCAQLTNHYGG